MRVRDVWALVTIEFGFLIAAAISAFTPCPEHTTWIDDGSCLIIVPSKGSLPETLQHQQSAAQQCEKMVVGGMTWHLPKVDTKTKRKNIATALTDFISRHPPRIFATRSPNATEEVLLPFVWLGLRRRRPWTSGQDKSDESWYWTVDNCTLKLGADGLLFWGQNQPDNLGRILNASEECAIAVVNLKETDEEKLQFHDKPCSAPTGGELITPVNLIGVACTAKAKIEQEHITRKWWFIVVCVVAAVLPTILVAVGLAVFYGIRSRRRRRQMKASRRATARSSQSGGSRRSRRSHRKKKKKRKPKFDKSCGGESNRSRTLESFNESDIAIPIALKPFKSGFAKSTIAKSTSAGLVSANASDSVWDDDKHEYSNVLPLYKPPKTKTSVKVVASMQSDRR